MFFNKGDISTSLQGFQENRDLDPKIIDLWATSPEREWYFTRREIALKKMGIAFFIIVCAAILASLGSNLRFGQIENPSIIVGLIFALGVILLIWSTAPYICARQSYSARKRGIASYRTDEALKELKKVMESTNKELQLPSLFYLNRRQLDEYQVVTKRQQKIAFGLTWSATVFAFIILIGGTILALNQQDDIEKYLAGGLTALGTLLSGYLGKTFYEGHKIATDQLNRYYTEPSLTGRLLAAERILSHLPENERNKQFVEMFSAILKWDPKTQVTESGDTKKTSEESDISSIM